MEVSLKIHETGRKRLGGCQAYSEFKKPNIFILNCSATNWYNEFVSSEAAMSKPLTIFFLVFTFAQISWYFVFCLRRFSNFVWTFLQQLNYQRWYNRFYVICIICASQNLIVVKQTKLLLSWKTISVILTKRFELPSLER